MSVPSPSPSPESSDAEPRRVLVIDDEESIRHSLAKSLKREGFVVETAATGREGVDRFAAGGYDAVLTDVRLPDLSGLDIVALCTELDADVPVVVMTGYASVDSALEAMRRGGRDYVQKPFRFADLLEVLRRAMAERQDARDARRLRARVERRFAPGDYERVEDELRRRPAVDRPADRGPEGLAPPSGLAAAMPSAAEEPLALRDAHKKFEVRYVEDLLSRTGGNVAAAARLAGISRPNFHKKLKSLGVDPLKFKRARWRGKSAPGGL